MADELKPVSVPGIGRVRSLSRDKQGENNEEFRNKLAGLVEKDESEDGAQRRPLPPRPAPQAEEPGAKDEQEDNGVVGHNLDMRT